MSMSMIVVCIIVYSFVFGVWLGFFFAIPLSFFRGYFIFLFFRLFYWRSFCLKGYVRT